MKYHVDDPEELAMINYTSGTTGFSKGVMPVSYTHLAYANYMAFAISAGAKIRTIATTIEEGFSLPKVEKFEVVSYTHLMRNFII